jgi:hypothetical protein
MKAALRDSYVEYVYFMGITEKYPPWFEEELYRGIYMDENRYTFYVPLQERSPDYYEKTLVEDYTVFLRKTTGEIHVTDYDVFKAMYSIFTYNAFYNCGVAAFDEDCIEFVECFPGVIPAGYPEWFYEYFTEAVNIPNNEETIFLYDTDKHRLTASKGSFMEIDTKGGVSVTDHCVFLRNRFGEIRGMLYDDFFKYYDPEPKGDELL